MPFKKQMDGAEGTPPKSTFSVKISCGLCCGLMYLHYSVGICMKESMHVRAFLESKWKLLHNVNLAGGESAASLSVSLCRKARGKNSHHRQSSAVWCSCVVRRGAREMQSCQNRRYTTSSRTPSLCRCRSLRRSRKKGADTFAPFFPS